MTPAEAAARSSRRSDFRLSAPRLELEPHLLNAHDFARAACAAAQRLIYEERRNYKRGHPLLKRRNGYKLGRPSKTHQPLPVEIDHLYAQRAEACAILVQVLIAKCSFRDGTVGRFDNGQIVEWYSLEQLGRMTRLAPDRLEHAVSDLRAAGFLHRWQHREEEGGEWIGFVALTRVLVGLWEFLGLEKRRRQLLREEEEERQRIAELERQAAAAARRGESLSPIHLLPDLAEQKRYAILTLEIGPAHPDWTDEQIQQAAYDQVLAERRERPPPNR